jgi:hypothetical protein
LRAALAPNPVECVLGAVDVGQRDEEHVRILRGEDPHRLVHGAVIGAEAGLRIDLLRLRLDVAPEEIRALLLAGHGVEQSNQSRLAEQGSGLQLGPFALGDGEERPT